MATPNKFAPSGITTNFTSNQLYQSKGYGYGGGGSGMNAPIPERMTSSI
jgi:hypothetical protein